MKMIFLLFSISHDSDGITQDKIDESYSLIRKSFVDKNFSKATMQADKIRFQN